VVASTGAVVTLTGQSVTSAQGLITAGVTETVALSGQELTAQQGGTTVVTSAAVPLTGQSIALAQGIMGVAGTRVVPLTGQEITAEQGAVAATVAFTQALTGQALTVEQGLVIISGTAVVALNGQQALLQQGVFEVSDGDIDETLVPYEYPGYRVAATYGYAVLPEKYAADIVVERVGYEVGKPPSLEGATYVSLPGLGVGTAQG